MGKVIEKIFLSAVIIAMCPQIAFNQTRQSRHTNFDAVDSVSQIIDTLISKGKYEVYTVSSVSSSNSSKCIRQYFIDSENSCIVKCIFDTSFEDYNKAKFTRIIVYFYHGHEFNSMWIEDKTSDVAFGSSYGNFLKDYKEYGGVGKFEREWSNYKMDEVIRKFIAREISFGKFMQKRDFGN
jgi:hypothetical protein